MFHFIPAAAHSSPFTGYPRHRGYQRPDPRERYLAALAEAKSAEAEYLESLEAEKYYAPRRSTATPFWGSYEPASYDDFSPSYGRHSSYEPSHYGAGLHRERARQLALLRLQEEEEQRLNLLRQERLRQVTQQQKEEQELQQFFARRQQLQRQQEVGLKRKMEERQQSQDIENFIKVLLGIVSDEDSAEKPKAATKPEGCGSFACKPSTAAAKPSSSPSSSTEKAPAAPTTKPSGCPARSSYGGCGYRIRPVIFRPASAPATTTKAPGASLKAELEARLAGEESNEIKDTIQAILASLVHPQPSPSLAPAPTQRQQASESSSGKGKAKVSNDVDTTPAAPTDMDIARAFSQIDHIEHSFVTLEDSFTFPSKVDFSPPASPSPSISSTVKLAYTSNNAPIHNYQHALSEFLTQLDGIESYGNEAVRHRRKEVVDKVEGALEGVERLVEEKGEIESRRSSVLVEEKPAVEGYSVEDDSAPAYEEEVKKDDSTESAAPLEPLEGSIQHPLNFDTVDTVTAPAASDSTPAEDVSESVATVKPVETEPEDLADSSDDEELGGKSFLLSADSVQEIPTEVKKPNVTDDTEDGAGSDWSEVEA